MPDDGPRRCGCNSGPEPVHHVRRARFHALGCSTPYLATNACTVRYEVTVDVGDGEWSYESDTKGMPQFETSTTTPIATPRDAVG
ncbi:MAG: hypothetical protein R2789_15785 [Microthrixaceae bacterium]